MNDILWNLLPELIGSFVGAFLGFFLGMLLEKKTREGDEKERKEDTIKSLIAEITINKSILDEGPEKFSDINVSHNIVLFTDAFDSAVFSGSYQLLKVGTQRITTYFFNGSKRMNRLSELLRSLLLSQEDPYGARSREARHISHEIMRLYSRLNKAAEKMLSQLKEELGYTWTFQVEE